MPHGVDNVDVRNKQLQKNSLKKQPQLDSRQETNIAGVLLNSTLWPLAPRDAQITTTAQA